MVLEIKNAKIAKVGDSYFFRIPKQFIDNGLFDLDGVYDMVVILKGKKEVSENEDSC